MRIIMNEKIINMSDKMNFLLKSVVLKTPLHHIDLELRFFYVIRICCDKPFLMPEVIFSRASIDENCFRFVVDMCDALAQESRDSIFIIAKSEYIEEIYQNKARLFQNKSFVDVISSLSMPEIEFHLQRIDLQRIDS